jgi:hypothetical protein
MIMTKGKDPETADGLGGVHKVAVDRPAAERVPSDPEPVVVGHGPRPGSAGLVDDPDQIARTIHTEAAPIEPPNDANARESTVRPVRTPQAPFQDARIAPDEPSAWSAENASPPRD